MTPRRDGRPGFSRRAQYGLFLGYILAVAGAAIGALLLLISTFNPPAFAALRSGVAEITSPVSTAAATAVRWIAAVPQSISTYFFVHDENARLRFELERSRTAVLNGRIALRDNRRLRRLVDLREGADGVIVAARIVSSSSSSTRRFGLMNAGRWQGVRPGQPVRGPDGLIGRTIETGPNTARVLLLTDPESVIPVRRLSDGMPALAAGRGDGMVDIRSATLGAVRFRVGDIFLTSGTGGLFVPDVPVARVVANGSDNVAARPFASPDTLDFALVLRAFLPPPPPAAEVPREGDDTTSAP